MESIRKIVSALLLVGLIVVLALFAFQNANQTTVAFLSYQTPMMPVFVFLIGAFMGGILFAGIFALSEYLRLNARSRRQQREIQALEKQLQVMRQQPLLDDFSVSSRQPATTPTNTIESDTIDDEETFKRMTLLL